MSEFAWDFITSYISMLKKGKMIISICHPGAQLLPEARQAVRAALSKAMSVVGHGAGRTTDMQLCSRL
jgi:hypothetical protein